MCQSACWNDAFVRDYVKMGLYSVIRWQCHCSAAKTYLPILLGLGMGVIYGSIVALRQKDLKLLAFRHLLT
jgi:NADH:ubiquinone oxidoreductase subunit 4 (subunit M)